VANGFSFYSKHEIVFPNITLYNPAVKRLQIGEIK
jgi:hypothetical protein